MIYNHHQFKIHQRGAVSLFVVIFTAMLITTITISFMQLMVKDQEQAMYSDLSESAYDSATAGVEDAKRALLMQQDCIGSNTQTCKDVVDGINSGECTTLEQAFTGQTSGDEVAVIQSQGDRMLEQAYTCVKITQDTEDYLGSMNPNGAGKLLPLRSTAAFNNIIISWGLSKTGADITVPKAPAPGENAPLPSNMAATADWPKSYPALLRAQLINGHSSFRLSDFDNTHYSNTYFLYPSETGDTSRPFALDNRSRTKAAAPVLVACPKPFESGEYACSIRLVVNSSISAEESKNAFLNLAAFYNGTDYKVELMNGTNPVRFDNVQPEVDSTGRANDLFRRVVSRVELNNTFKYPVAAIESRNSICKDFSVTTNPDDYSVADLSECNPEN